MLEKFSENVKLVVKHFPLPQHGYARKAAAAAIAANEQGKFWNYHQELFKNYQSLNDEKTLGIAIELGLDIKKFKNDLKSAAAEKRIALDVKYGRDKNVPHVPSLYVNGKFLKNNTLQDLTTAINAELAKKE